MPRWEVVLHEARSIIPPYRQESSPQRKHIFPLSHALLSEPSYEAAIRRAVAAAGAAF